MIIPDYIPEPLEVPGNVHDGPYAERVRFNRRVALIFTGTTALAAIASRAIPAHLLCLPTFVAWSGLLALVRIELRGTYPENRAMSLALPITGAIFAWLISTYPALLAVPLGAAVFSAVLLLSGRDFSVPFGAILTMAAVGLAGTKLGLVEASLKGYATVVLSVTYFAFDFWCLAYRRRSDEAIAAAHDLFRDYLNIFGYIARVIRHWRRHRLWQDLPPH